MKFLTTIILSIMVFSISCVYGQESKKEKAKNVFAAKLYIVSTFKSNNELSIGTNETTIAKSFSPTISWGKEYGNYNEIELTDFNFKKNSFGKQFNIGSRYCYNWKVYSKSDESRFSYFIGAGVRAKYAFDKITFPISQSEIQYNPSFNYSMKTNGLIMSTSVIPRVNIKMGKRTYLDISTPYEFYDYSWSKYENISKEDVSKGNNTNSTAFPNKFTVNVGVAIKF